jgi:ABC-type nitrate/sulfonate/bicarbonate transport system substrate-binding protein
MAARVRLGLFSPSVVLGVAAHAGLPQRAGIAIEEVPATSSAEQLTALLAGDLDAALTSPDNVIAARLRGADVRIVAAVDRGLGLSLFTAPGAELGGVLAVDVPTSGFAFVAYELLARAGLRASHDYEVRALGTTPHRARALVAGECTMTILGAGSDLRAEAAGCRRVARATSFGPYLGTVLATTGDRVTDPRTRALTTVLLFAIRSTLDSRCRDVAAEMTAARLGLSEVDVQRYLETLADPTEGLVPDGRVDPDTLATLRRLRERHGSGFVPQSTLDTLVDERLLDTS